MGIVNQLIEFTNRGPYEKGEELVTHKGKTSNTVVNSKSYEDYADEILNAPFKTWTIPLGYEHRPDSIANYFYRSPELFWIIMTANGITDPFESLGAGTKIKIPQI